MATPSSQSSLSFSIFSTASSTSTFSITSSVFVDQTPFERLHDAILEELTCRNYLIWKVQFTPYLQVHDLENMLMVLLQLH